MSMDVNIIILILCLLNFVFSLVQLFRIEKPPVIIYGATGDVVQAAQPKQKPEERPYREQDIYENLRTDKEDPMPIIQTLPEEDGPAGYGPAKYEHRGIE